jgi:site-specific recombinase XerD
VAQFLERWIADVVEPNERPATISKYKQYIRLYFTPHLGRIALAKLTRRHVQGLIRSLQEHGLAPDTIRRVITMLRVALPCATTLLAAM